MVQEFKTFVLRGNVVDLAVGVIVGGAFGKITTSLVNDVIMPPIGMLLGGMDFKSMALTIRPATEEVAAVTINYGAFINTLVDFLIIAFVLFMVIKAINSLKRKEEAAPAAPAAPPADVALLTEIRDLLKKG
ncbi:MAG: large-conductance mechanosensitive channel protein MscL [Kiritimatiellae bacterium]|nr:large-conductance mechanosensitive channel protein MscL [Kiritimatiellia bacterium]